MPRVYQIQDPANNVLNEIPLEDNIVLLSGYCSEFGTISQGKLFAKSGDNFQAIYEDSVNGFTDEEFLIGTPIYCYMGSSPLSDVDIIDTKAYTSYYDVSITANGGNTAHVDSGDALWLVVTIDNTNRMWRPIALIGSNAISSNYSGNCFIYLGTYRGDKDLSPVPNEDSFMLEINNPMFYYDGTNLIEYEVWLAKQNSGSITQYFRSFNNSGSAFHFTPSSQTQVLIGGGDTLPAGSYLVIGEAIFVNIYGKPLQAHAILKYRNAASGDFTKIAAADVTLPAGEGSGAGFAYGAMTVHLSGWFRISTPSSVLSWGIELEVEAPATSTEYAYVPDDCPVSGSELETCSHGAQIFLQRVGNYNN